MIKLKHKPKVKPKDKPLSPSALADKIHQRSADAKGMTLKEFKKERDLLIASSKRYSKTHWVQPLSDAQKSLIVATTSMPHTYMSFPLSKGNADALEIYKKMKEDISVNNYLDQHNEHDQRQRIKRVDYPEVSKLDTTLRQKIKELEDAEYSYDTKNAIRNNKKIASREVSELEITELKEARRRAGIEVIKLREKITKEYQEIGRKLRFSNDNLKNSILGKGLGVKSLLLNIPDFPPIQTGIISKHIRETKVRASNGLNTLMRENKLKTPLDIADHYLKVHKDPSKIDYFVDSMENPIALAETTGISAQRLFEMVCVELKGSKKKYQKLQMEKNAIAIEDLLNLFDSKVASSTSIKYTKKQFYSSKDRHTWSATYGYDWAGYKRFNEDFNSWNIIFKAEAKKIEDLDADKFKDWVKVN